MLYRRLGKAGVRVSELSYGTWVTFGPQIKVPEAEKIFGTCFDHGVNFFDNAEGYSRGESERIMGKALQNLNQARDSYLVSSKVFFGAVDKPKPNQYGLSKKHVIEACNQALERLKVDYLDLYFCHRPDSHTPIEETVRAMHTLIMQGKVLYWGTSEWSAQQIMEAYSVARQFNLTPPTMEQPQYNMLSRHRFEEEYKRLYSEIGLGTTIWSPLASGVLTGKYLDKVPEGSRVTLKNYEWLKSSVIDSDAGKQNMIKAKLIKAVADELGISMTHLALAWCLKNPNVSTVILGASNTNQLLENLKAGESVKLLTDDVMEQIQSIIS